MFSLVKHLRPLPRSCPLLPQINTIGFLPRKWERMNHTFDTCNFSFILRGCGELRFRERAYRIEAPCFFFQLPNERFDYAPDSYWDELFLIYDAEDCGEFLRLGFLNPDRPVRKLNDAAGILKDAETLELMLQRENLSADRVDLFCYSMLLKSVLANDNAELETSLIPQIRRRLAQNFGAEPDIRAIAAEFGMSISTLRRYWLRHHGPESFSAYRAARFLQESCHLLVETPLPIKSIAARLGFDDACYFSRKFRRLLGMTPKEYRRRNSSFVRSALEAPATPPDSPEESRVDSEDGNGARMRVEERKG